ncbi:hypothetical protein EWM64_g4826 [Hericium alpestre]|uniref:Polysaccharide lyase 14 domain-containing protein n=1 Tax=Hericium alpestre TaxID=135208 RepID=A0A4Y9ZYA8_9AGAM|nr:hypothetical protein EWM64_g4826 [Hericium alpestre]
MPIRRTLSAEATLTQEIFEILTAPKPKGFIEPLDKRLRTVPVPLHPYPPTEEVRDLSIPSIQPTDDTTTKLKRAIQALKPLRALPDALLFDSDLTAPYPPAMEYGYPITPEQILLFAELCPKVHRKKRENDEEPAGWLAACWLANMIECKVNVRTALNAPYGVIVSLGNNFDLPDRLNKGKVTDERICALRDMLEITDGSRPRWYVSEKISPTVFGVGAFPLDTPPDTSPFAVQDATKTSVSADPGTGTVPPPSSSYVVSSASDNWYLSSSVGSSTEPAASATTILEVITVTQAPSTIIVTAPASTVTETDFITAQPPDPSSGPESPTPDPNTSGRRQTKWTMPAQMSDLAPFNITKFASGKDNLVLVSSEPSSAAASGSTSTSASQSDIAGLLSGILGQDPDPSNVTASSTKTLLQLFYPKGSINPANTDAPVGGAEFYASPPGGAMEGARNVTLAYDVYFPADFEWVKGGKLPGLYGGHTMCSGGDDALSCFSTRLMWRENGAGEMYLYAPKNKQTQGTCSLPPESHCDTSYGLSLARGSFHFAPGAWTHVHQTIYLNTPGVQDGGMYLEVNGRPVINRQDIYYRGVTPTPVKNGDSGGADDDLPTIGDGDPGGTDGDPPTNTTTTAPTASPSDGGDDLLSPLLGGLFGGDDGSNQSAIGVYAQTLNDQIEMLPSSAMTSYFPLLTAAAIQPTGMVTATTTTTVFAETVTQMVDVSPGGVVQELALPTMDEDEDALSIGIESYHAADSTDVIGFSGLFFSTFFGGHDTGYASPKDQYTWFKGFALTINDRQR